MSLPRQLEWRHFASVLGKLGYVLHKAGPGSSRHYVNNIGRQPRVVFFHEPHQPKTIPAGTLRAYIRQLNLSLEEFLELLDR